ncbi:hypothetical protein T4A_6698 [Trichinella pseudospiralis]|uniref:Uncharacterized protein n=1 Tax=Trichinella pseudospiralis TaxID=6337 RepID=A0A0V1DPZ4_TRIPS|nr:hypothetical protein T4A_6698 [Trichinella pseudospiralis]
MRFANEEKDLWRRQALDSSATFRRQRVYYRPRSTKDYTKSYDKKIKQTERGTLYRTIATDLYPPFGFEKEDGPLGTSLERKRSPHDYSLRAIGRFPIGI